MKKLALLVLLVPFCMASSCIDTTTGTKRVVAPDGTVSYVPDGTNGGPLGAVAGLLGFGGIASVLSNVWLALRNRSASGALTAAVAGVQEIKATLTPEQMARMAAAQERIGAKAKEIVRSVAHKIEGKKDS